MKTLLRLLPLFLLGIVFTARSIPAQTDSYKVLYSDGEMVIREIDPETFLVTHTFPWPANSLVLKFKKNQFLLIDTPYTDEATERLVTFLKKNTPGEIKISAINTHFHVDNLGGNGYLKKINARIYGSSLTVRLLKERGLGQGMLESMKNMPEMYTYYKSKKLTAPDNLFPVEKGLKLHFGRDTVEVWYPGAGHTKDNVVVYYPKKKILFGGCILKAMESSSKGNLGDADIHVWKGSVEKLLARYPEAKLVVPGHGATGGIEIIRHTIDIVSE
ncbi:MAG: MBL fold metallo-hydrolase [Bacteroidota bacterium]|jgi:glyoxylase-like metal-dependent hydrolase (beta-lactamase superfamily II)|nr:subclass B1 metallo-beta-lactamase [Ignavibacteria bacterium]MCU7498099.1 subclass B1 metallo-beta-lactamase [Ignavibacteria bacterium]MCU7513102.1 subclass B1 metallo-beta-lactamase [Ignavibacteria bacterium]MCU7520383.1 subclass B1 metallo-beta-lactamase [Ignavibacteria bacterium]MCU7524873.1 subclass B1 metallo-beta-lactamase [Ignavibacteria bacterium]